MFFMFSKFADSSEASDAGLGHVDTLRQVPKQKKYWTDKEVDRMWRHLQPYIMDPKKPIPPGTMKRVLPHFPNRAGPIVRAKMQSMQREYAKGKIKPPTKRK